MTEFFETPQGRKIAYDQIEGAGPTVLFLCGLESDKEGTKALHLEAWARARGQAFVRFDYSGHGESSGAFTDGCIGDWHEDTLAVVDTLIDGPVVIVGSSMGGWQALLLARERPARVAGMVGIAAAPDFTEDGYAAGFTDDQWAEMQREGRVVLPSDWGDRVITRRLIEDGRNRLVLRTPLELPCSVRLLQGTADTAVPTATAVRLLEHAKSPDMRLTLVKDADHRFSDPTCLALMECALIEVMEN